MGAIMLLPTAPAPLEKYGIRVLAQMSTSRLDCRISDADFMKRKYEDRD
jgi:hypothetical protein